MKTQFKKAATILASLVIASLIYPAAGQPTSEKKKMTAEEAKEWEKAQVSENTMAKLSAKEKADAKEKGKIIAAYFLKAVLNKMDPASYPVDAAADSPEKITADIVKKLPADVFKKISEKAVKLTSDPTKRSKLLGKFKDVDFKKASITSDIKKLTTVTIKPVAKKQNEKTDGNVKSRETISSLTGVGGGIADIETIVPKYNGLDLVLRAIDCVDETNPEGGSDDMVVGGLLIGASGNTNNANGFDAGDFDDGTYRNYGSYPFGTYSLNTTSGYPKVFYCVLMLIESDSDDEELAKDLNAVMGTIGTIVASFWGLGEFVAAAAEAVDAIIGIFISDDPFYPYGITLKLNSSDQFGSDGTSENKRTANITDHGGTYRVGYKWVLKN